MFPTIGQAKATPTGRALKVSHPGAAPAAKSDVYDCFALFVIKLVSLIGGGVNLSESCIVIVC